MSRVFSTDAFQDLTALWKNQIVDPNTLPQAGGLGSVYVRNGTYPTVPTETYYRSSLANVAGNRGWVKQNLVNLNIFNVTKAPFNCDKTGVSDCRVGAQAAIDAAAAAGGGCVYFPPGTYLFGKNGTATSILSFSNKSNVVLMGDGYNTLIRMAGDFGGTAQWWVEINNQSKRILIYNLRLNGAGIINPAAGAQNHLIEFFDNPATYPAGPPSDCEVRQVWFDPIIGDGVRMVADFTGTREIKNIRVRFCMFNMNNGVNGARTNISFSRGGQQYQIHDNWFGTISGGGQNIDFEPGGQAPFEVQIVGNIFGTSTQTAVTLSGVDSPRTPSQHNVFARNIMTATPSGASLEAVAQPTLLLIKGNIITCAGDTSNFAVVELRNLTKSAIVDNIFVSLDNTQTRPALFIYADNPGNPTSCVIAGNLLKAISDATNMVPVRLETCNQFQFINNMVFLDAAASAGTFGVQFRSTNAIGSDWTAVGNMIIATAGTILRGFAITADPNAASNINVSDNLVHTVNTGILFDTTVAAITKNVANGNIIAGATVAVITPPSSNVGARIEGQAGSTAPNFSLVSVVPATACAANAGSVALDTTGAADTVLFTKESGASTTTGWIADGAVPLAFGALALSTATASRFLAPGAGLAAESATEIKVPVDRPGTLRNGRMKCTAGTGGTTVNFFVRVNGADSTLQLATNNTTSQASFNAGAPVVAAGDLIGIRIAKGTAPTTPQTNVVVTLEITS